MVSGRRQVIDRSSLRATTRSDGPGTVVPHLRHATIGAAQLATPVIAAIGGALFLGETLTWRLGLAAALIVVGIAPTLRQPANLTAEPHQ